MHLHLSLPSPASHYLNVLLANQPRTVRKDLVQFAQFTEFGRDVIQPSQPLGVTTHPQELQHMEVHQVATAVPGSCLQGTHQVPVTA